MAPVDLERSVKILRQLEKQINPKDVWKIPAVYQGSRVYKRIGYKQVPGEISCFYRQVVALSPRYLLEIGTYRGGTFYLWCQAASENAILISIDLPGGLGDPYSPDRIKFYRKFAKSQNQKLHFVAVDSHQQAAVGQVSKILGANKLDFLFIDGDHTYQGVKQDFEYFKPFVRSGGMIGFHDILPRSDFPDIQVYKFWSEIKDGYRHEEIIAKNEPYANFIGMGVIWLD